MASGRKKTSSGKKNHGAVVTHGVQKKMINPVVVLLVSIPHFLFGAVLAAVNWRRLGHPEKAGNIIKWSIMGTIVLIILSVFIPLETHKKLWPVGIGVNLGVGMFFKQQQMPEYQKDLGKSR
ncbi:MAG: hypothetical protein CVU89_08895 [Firmicutes bacterium HGW-Firmicutes-14]|nr:MAG: hypothetical protein CVU89_08895 [Firmicutes bacterium HGW-Firmicutes-14]